MTAWITAAQLGAVADISDRKARAALARAASGKAWRGVSLRVQATHTRGGASGRAFLVAADSLPIDLQARLNDPQTPVQLALKLDDAEASVRNMRFHIIGPVLKTESGTPERAAATMARSKEQFILDGKPFPASERSIQRWAEKHEAEGFAGLTRKKRKDAGKPAAVVTDAWDRAVKLPEATGRAIRAKLDSYIASLRKAGESPSIIPHHAQRELLEMTRKAGCGLPTEALLAACAIPGHLIRDRNGLGNVTRFKTDRKEHEDKRPRISRSAPVTVNATINNTTPGAIGNTVAAAIHHGVKAGTAALHDGPETK